jgi:hypothetical protein
MFKTRKKQNFTSLKSDQLSHWLEIRSATIWTDAELDKIREIGSREIIDKLPAAEKWWMEQPANFRLITNQVDAIEAYLKSSGLLKQKHL